MRKADQVDVTQFLISSAIQYIRQIRKKEESWKKWLFFLLQFALGEGFRIDSFRDYPQIKEDQIKLNKFLCNQYDLKIYPPNKFFELRIARESLEQFIIKDPSGASVIKPNLRDIQPPLDKLTRSNLIRVLDLKIIPKRSYHVTPGLKALQLYLVQWEDSVLEEQSSLILPEKFPPKEEITTLPAILSEEELQERKWTKYRDTTLEQPYGLYCPNCQLTYEPNILAKMCSSCFIPLMKA
jgi:hypothetical protein